MTDAPDIDPQLDEALRVLQAKQEHLDQLTPAWELARVERARAILHAAEVGIPKTEIAKRLGVSRGRIHQVIAAAAKTAEQAKETD